MDRRGGKAQKRRGEAEGSPHGGAAGLACFPCQKEKRNSVVLKAQHRLSSSSSCVRFGEDGWMRRWGGKKGWERRKGGTRIAKAD